MKYYKGLGSSTDVEAQESFADFANNMFSYRIRNKEDDTILTMAFDCQYADDRKTMIKKFNGEYLDYEKVRDVSC